MKKCFDEFGRGNLPRLPFHKNPGLEIVHLQRGRLAWSCEGKTEVIHPDSLYFTLPWQEHGSTCEFEPGHNWSFVVIRLPGSDDTRPTPFRFPTALGFDTKTTATVRRILMEAPRHSWPSTPLSRVLMAALLAELEIPGMLHQQRLVHLTSQLILELAAILSHPENCEHSADAGCFSPLLAELERTFADPWTLEQMASIFGLKHSQFSILFRRYTGDSPLHYLNRLRIDKARFRLRNSPDPITDIAFGCGFCSSQHFARVFRQFTGMTALEYRQKKVPVLRLPRSGRAA